jgi:putative sigma-54 modulation protein
MRLIVKGRHMAVTPALQEYAEEKVGKSSRIIDYMLKEAEVELWVEKNPAIENNHVCEITLWTKGPVIRAKEAATDMYAAIDMATDKLERQLRKYKGKLVDRHTGKHRPPMPEPIVPEEILEATDDRSVVKTKRVDLQPMTEEEAILQLELLGHDFFVFTHSEDDRYSVLYRREDGDYGLIQPE